MRNETTADTAAKTEREGGSLAQRLRDEGDYSDCKYQYERLHGFADEVDTLRTQLEAAEAHINRLDAAFVCAHAQLEARAEAAEAKLLPGELRKVAKRNLRSMIERGSDDRDLMLKCLEELS